jgi:hypothetical protein
VRIEAAAADAPPPAQTDRFPLAALIAGYGSVASALPYLALKIVWLSGGTLGAANPEVMRDDSMIVLNAVTAGMDLIAIALALAFTHAWGLRIPAWLLLPPMWVASGLLATFVVGVPIAVIHAALTDGLPRITGGPVQPWVYAVVYTEFTGLGIGLMAAFFLYARRKWPALLEPPANAAASGPTRDVQILLANTLAFVSAVLAALYLAWASGADVGLSADAAARRTMVSTIMNGMHGLLMLAAAAGMSMIVHGAGGRVPSWLPVSMAWVGSGSMFGWGAWQLVNVLGATALMRNAEPMPLANVASFVRTIAGASLGLLLIFTLAGRRAGGRSP